MTREEAKASLEKIRMHFLFSGNFWEDTKSEVSEAIDLAIEALSAETVHGYTEWLEKNIVEAETFEWLCEDTTDEEWCEKNCKYSSIQAECLRHLYEVSKGGDRWEV